MGYPSNTVVRVDAQCIGFISQYANNMLPFFLSGEMQCKIVQSILLHW